MNKVQITITLNPKTGQIQVSAPPDKILALGMLEFAKHTFLNRTVQPPKVAIPQMVLNKS